MNRQNGRSMIEMLCVLLVVFALSIGGLWGYRRSVDKYQADAVINDVNQLSAVIMEKKSQLPEGIVTFADFNKSSPFGTIIRNQKGPKSYQISVVDVPENVCREVLHLKPNKFKVYVGSDLYGDDDSICGENNLISFLVGKYSNPCGAGYKLLENGTCQQCSVAHCASATSYDDNCKCTACQNGYVVNASGTCNACDGNALHCFGNYYDGCKCGTCAPGYRAVNGVCEECPSNPGCSYYPGSNCACSN